MISRTATGKVPWVLSAIFFLSGAVALIYEVLWQRKFSLLFGSSAPATAAILAAYFGGLCIGNFAFGKVAHRWRRPLLVYGVLELFIAGGALLVDPILHGYGSLYPNVIASFGSRPNVLLALKGILGFAAIAIPTIAMGATLPVLALAVDARKEALGLRVGWLYLVNTTGAALGTVAVPLFLLPQLGMRLSSAVCVATNVFLALVSMCLSSSIRLEGKIQSASEHPNARTTLALSFFSGFGLFALQVLWNRAFAQVHQNSMWSFALITTVFILAIAAASHIARMLLHRTDPAKALGSLWIAGGTLAMISPIIFLELTDKLTYIPQSSTLLGISTIFIPIALLAGALPLLIQSIGIKGPVTASSATGLVLGVNTLGCIAGALAGGFLLPPWLGLWRSISVIAIIFLAAGLEVRRNSPFTISRPFRLVHLMPAILLILALQLDLPRTFLRSSETLLALREGSHGIASVIQRNDGSRRLKLNNHYILGGTLATGDQRMQAHIPLLLGPTEGHVGFLGYGTGITAGGALFHTNFIATAIELVPEVSHLASVYFGPANGQFGSTQTSKIILDDARNYLRGTAEKFDVLVGDLVVPWRQGEGSLYTREHFAAVKASLNPGGLFCAWIPMFQITDLEFQIIARTFLAVFKQAYLWRGDFSPAEPSYGLVAFNNGTLDPARTREQLRKMRADPQNLQLAAAAAFWMHFIGQVAFEDFPANVPLNSEDTPWLELGYGRHRETFVGRNLQVWENRIRDKSRPLLETFPDEAKRGAQAGRLMVEFTHLSSERNQNQSAQIQAEIKQLLGETTARLIFGQ